MMRPVDKRRCAYETWHLVIQPRDLERHEKFINGAILSIMSLCNQVINPRGIVCTHNQPFSWPGRGVGSNNTRRDKYHRDLEVFGNASQRKSLIVDRSSQAVMAGHLNLHSH
jgi:hypothetical protein